MIVWWSHGYSITDIQQITPAILSRTAEPTVTAIYHQATTMTLAAIVACQVGNLFACRSEWVSAWKMSWTNNQLLWLGVAVECAALLVFVYYPPLSNIFTTAPLTVWQWFLLLACPLILLGAEELRKVILSKARR